MTLNVSKSVRHFGSCLFNNWSVEYNNSFSNNDRGLNILSVFCPEPDTQVSTVCIIIHSACNELSLVLRIE